MIAPDYDCPRCAAERALVRLRELLDSGPSDIDLLNHVAGRALGHLSFIAEDAGALCARHHVAPRAATP